MPRVQVCGAVAVNTLHDALQLLQELLLVLHAIADKCNFCQHWALQAVRRHAHNADLRARPGKQEEHIAHLWNSAQSLAHAVALEIAQLGNGHMRCEGP